MAAPATKAGSSHIAPEFTSASQAPSSAVCPRSVRNPSASPARKTSPLATAVAVVVAGPAGMGGTRVRVRSLICRSLCHPTVAG